MKIERKETTKASREYWRRVRIVGREVAQMPAWMKGHSKPAPAQKGK